ANPSPVFGFRPSPQLLLLGVVDTIVVKFVVVAKVVDVAVAKQTALGSSKLVFLLAAPFSSVFTSTFLHLLNLIPSSP
ncbi:hypothetical protein Godav_011567, partial [Gossypium davidsonii]|nr:hypothetical protein [Gossypium davidsonii]